MSSSLLLPSTTDSSLGADLHLAGATIFDTMTTLRYDSRRKSSAASATSTTPEISATRLAELEHENDLLRRQLEKIGKLDGIAIERSSRPPSRDRRESSPAPTVAGIFRRNASAELDALRSENADLVERLREQADDLAALRQERESLLLTIQLLQDDLTLSERQRQREHVASPTS